MEGYIDENNWVDLSNLPRRGSKIYWDKSIGLTIPFKYNGIDGVLVVLERLKRQHGVRVYLQNYTDNDGYTLETYALRHCQLGGLLRKNILLNAPHVIPYLVNENDKFLPCGSQQMIDVVCQICGLKKKIKVHELVKCGLRCNRCSDGISYPNKFILNLLDQSGCMYDFEISKAKYGYAWLKNYRYDFLINIDNQRIFIEADGGYHYKNYFDPEMLQYQKQRDNEKDILAAQHGFRIIRINCDYGRIEKRYAFIKNSILTSELRILLSLDSINIDWDECDRAGCINLYMRACDYWNNGMRRVSEIAKTMKIDPETVRRYLKGGAQYGLCDYDAKQALMDTAKNRSKPIAVFDNCNNVIGMFRSYQSLIDESVSIFGRQFNRSLIYACCEGRVQHAYGYGIRYVSLQEYENFLLQPINTLTVQNE